VNGHESGEAQSSRYVLPRDLDAAIKHLDDRELERLILAALQERDRRKLPVSEKSERTEMAPAALPQGKLNAIRAAFKAGVPVTDCQTIRSFTIRCANNFGRLLQDTVRLC
jgi:hypothetical protein